MICLAITGAAKTAPQLALETLLNIPPLELHIQAEARITAHSFQKIINRNVYPWRKDHSSILQDLVEYEPSLNAPVDRCHPCYVFSRTFKVEIHDSSSENNVYEEGNPLTIRWFTDASVNNQGSGYGIYNANNGAEYYGYLGKQAEITQAELAAILNCGLEIANDINSTPIQIFSDSLGALKLLNKPKIESKLVMDCVQILEIIARRREVTLIWTPAHSTSIGNEIADTLAKKGVTELASGPEPFLPSTERKCRAICEKWLQEKKAERWRHTNTCSHTKSLVILPDEKITKQLLSLDKQKVSYIVGILTGHIRLNAYLKRIGIRDDPDCEFCGRGEESAIHFLCNCPNLSQLRSRLYGHSFLNPGEVMTAPLRNIFDFARQSGRFPSLSLTSPSLSTLNRRGDDRNGINTSRSNR